jgi:hypothetical protein
MGILRILKEQFEMPWLCSRDFNEILFGFEKEGEQPKAESNMHKSRLALEDCDLHDLGFVGDVQTICQLSLMWGVGSVSARDMCKQQI